MKMLPLYGRNRDTFFRFDIYSNFIMITNESSTGRVGLDFASLMGLLAINPVLILNIFAHNNSNTSNSNRKTHKLFGSTDRRRRWTMLLK